MDNETYIFGNGINRAFQKCMNDLATASNRIFLFLNKESTMQSRFIIIVLPYRAKYVLKMGFKIQVKPSSAFWNKKKMKKNFHFIGDMAYVYPTVSRLFQLRDTVDLGFIVTE